jgi:hypothetical protein
VHIPAILRCSTPPSANELVPRVLLARPAGAAMWVPQLLLPRPAASQQLAPWVLLLPGCSCWPTPRPSTGRLLLHRAVMRRTHRAGSALQRAARPGLTQSSMSIAMAGRAPRAPSRRHGKNTPTGRRQPQVTSAQPKFVRTLQWPPAAFRHDRRLHYDPEHCAVPPWAVGRTLDYLCARGHN